MNERNLSALALLPATFRYSDARAIANDRRLRELLEAGLITRLGRGTYRKVTEDRGTPDADLIEIAAQRPLATLCLRAALSHHDLIDDIPTSIDIALPRNSRSPETRAPVTWHHFARSTFELGRTELELDPTVRIGLYSASRSIVDAYRLRHLEGSEVGHEALRRWLRAGGQPSELLAIATAFPAASTSIRIALEVLL